MNKEKVSYIEKAVFQEIITIIKHNQLTSAEKAELLHRLQQSIVKHLHNLQDFDLEKEKRAWTPNIN